MKMESASYSEDMRFLAEFTEAVVESARVYPGQSVTTANSLKMGCSRNSSQITLIRPGGRACYPAVWTQDFALALASGWIFDEMIAHFRQEDFRKGEDYHAPWECFGKDGSAGNNPLFLDSVAVPFGVLKCPLHKRPASSRTPR